VIPEPFSYELDQERRVLVTHGEIDELAAVELRSTIAEVTDDLTSDIAIDLGDVTFLPSVAIGVLASSRAKAADLGATITFVAPEGSLAKRLLVICGLDHAERPPAPEEKVAGGA
jgi:anti-anti-sigma factor